MVTRTTTDPSAGTAAGRTPDRGTPARTERLATETRASFKTSELLAYLGVLAGILIAGFAIEDDGGNDFFAADKVWLYATILTVGYMISRGLAKSGSREPYWAGGTNEQRDRDGRFSS